MSSGREEEDAGPRDIHHQGESISWTKTHACLRSFWKFSGGLPRQGPGCEASTLAALALCKGLPERPAVLDIGCGPGRQTIALARATGGRATAVDLLPEYLDQLRASAATAGVAEQVEILEADMRELPFAPESFDLLWSEGAAYNMGFANALESWRPLLRPGGWLAVSELVWLEADPPGEVREFFAEAYPPMTDIATNLQTLRASGYAPAEPFVLPDAAWWEHYYTPLEAKLPALAERFAGDGEALGVLAMTRREIEMRRRFGESYGYAFFVGKRG